MDITTNTQRFEALLKGIKRDGMQSLLDYIRKSDFFRAPASTRFHGSYEGGLLQHSLSVYDCLMEKKLNPIWTDILENVGDESLIIMALLHDVCKIHYYTKSTKNQKTYEPDKVTKAAGWQVKHDSGGDFIWETVDCFVVDNRMPLGHGDKSVIILQQFIRLTEVEIYAIRWHMGFSEPQNNYTDLGAAMELHPVVLALHEADLEASKLLEKDS